MTEIGIFLSSEESSAPRLVDIAVKAEAAGFRAAWISDHFHPWNDEQGESTFVWSVLGALAQATEMRYTTGVTCPTVRIHPAIVAHAAATVAQLLPDGRFALGVGTGEALNEHVLGDPWPRADVRLEMLEEAVEVMRLLWQGGVQTHEGKHYTVDRARIYSLPDYEIPVVMSAFGPKALELAVEIADGYATVGPDADSVKSYKDQGGKGVVQGGLKVCWAEDKAEAVKTAHRLWPNEELPGELAQILPTPQHFEQASELVTEEMIADAVVCGSDVDEHVEAIQEYIDAGFDEVYVGQMGDDHEGMLAFYEKEVLPRFA